MLSTLPHKIRTAVEKDTIGSSPSLNGRLARSISLALRGEALDIAITSKAGCGKTLLELLDKRYDPQRSTAKYQLLQKLMAKKCDGISDIQKYLSEKHKLFQSLVKGALDLKDILVFSTILGLPKELENTRDAALSRDNLDWESLSTMLVEKCELENDAGGEKETANYVGKGKTGVTGLVCGFCGKPGHAQIACRKWLKTREKGKGGLTDNSKDKGKGGAGGGGTKDLSKVKCFNCGKVGHTANKCFKKKN